MRQSTHWSRDKHLARPVINKKKYKEIIFLPCFVCLLRNGSVKKEYELERRELSMIKLSLWLIYSTCNNIGEKREKRNNCIYATVGTCYCVWMTVWYAGWNEQQNIKRRLQINIVQVLQRNIYTRTSPLYQFIQISPLLLWRRNAVTFRTQEK